jgi:hypothetical protein
VETESEIEKGETCVMENCLMERLLIQLPTRKSPAGNNAPQARTKRRKVDLKRNKRKNESYRFVGKISF